MISVHEWWLDAVRESLLRFVTGMSWSGKHVHAATPWLITTAFWRTTWVGREVSAEFGQGGGAELEVPGAGGF